MTKKFQSGKHSPADWYYLDDFNETNLKDGSGLPSNPNDVYTGINASIFRLANGEDETGKMVEINSIVQWVGESSIKGEWK